jgi:repressor LexA
MESQFTRLTTSQKRVLEALVKFIENEGFPPTTRELASILGIKAPSVHEQLRKLEFKGYLRRGKNKARSIEIIKSFSQDDKSIENGEVVVPILGHIAAGNPIFAQENFLGNLKIKYLAGRGRFFALKVQGNSMIDCGICDEDYVVVRQQPVAERGDIIAAIIGEDATVKRLKILQDKILLCPENRKFNPIDVTYREDFKIIGKVVQTIKSTNH